MKNTRNPDNRANYEDMKKKFNKTMHNAEIADDLITRSNDDQLKETLKDKNLRRKKAANSMKKELRDK